MCLKNSYFGEYVEIRANSFKKNISVNSSLNSNLKILLHEHLAHKKVVCYSNLTFVPMYTHKKLTDHIGSNLSCVIHKNLRVMSEIVVKTHK